MVKKCTGSHMVQCIGTNPISLLVGIKHIAFRVGPDSAWRTHSRADRNQLPRRRYFEPPTSPFPLPNVQCRVMNGSLQLLIFQSESNIERNP